VITSLIHHVLLRQVKLTSSKAKRLVGTGVSVRYTDFALDIGLGIITIAKCIERGRVSDGNYIFNAMTFGQNCYFLVRSHISMDPITTRYPNKYAVVPYWLKIKNKPLWQTEMYSQFCSEQSCRHFLQHQIHRPLIDLGV